MSVNPFLAQVSLTGSSPMSKARRALEPYLAEHMEGFGAALEKRACVTPEDMMKRVRAHTLMRIAAAAANQAKSVATELLINRDPRRVLLGAHASEAALAASTLNADITSFVTKMIHMSLDVWPRLIAPNLMSVQPLTQPHGYAFALTREARNNGDGGTGNGRNLANKDTFDSSFGDRGDFGVLAEGDQVRAIGVQLTKQLVEVKYMALMHQHSHEVDVAIRTQYGLNLEAMGDMATSDELAWEVDRQLVDALVTFAGTNTRGDKTFDDTKGGTYSVLTPSEQKAWDQTFLRKTMTEVAIEMSEDIYVQPNWYICGTNVAKLLARTPEALAEKNSNTYFDQSMVSGSIISSGRMKSGEQIWHDPQLDEDTLIAGHTNNMNPFYAGFIMLPFGAASVLTAAFFDPDTLLRKKSRALAFGKHGVNAQQYRVVRLGAS